MWDAIGEQTLGVVLGVLVAYGAHQVTRGGRKWRALTVARHELEVAGQLDPDSDLARRLQRRAHDRLKRYLYRPPPMRRAVRLSRAFLVIVSFTGVLVLAMLTDAEGFWDWAFVGFAGVAGSVVGLLRFETLLPPGLRERAGLRPRRRDRVTTPPPQEPSPHQPAAPPATPESPQSAAPD